MYVMDVEDFDDEEKDEKRGQEATGRNLQSKNKSSMTQSIYSGNNLKNSNIRFVKRTPEAIHSEDNASYISVDGQWIPADRGPRSEAKGSKNVYEKKPPSSHSSNVRSVERTPEVIHSEDDDSHIFVNGQWIEADRGPRSEAKGSKNVYEKKPPSSQMYSYKTSFKSEGIYKDVRETKEGKENLERGESRLSSSKAVVSFQSTSGEYSVSKSSNGDLLLLVNGKLFRHVKEEDIEDPVPPKTPSSKKSQTPCLHEKSLSQCKEKATVNSLSQVSRSSKRDAGRLLMASSVSTAERRKQQMYEHTLDQSEIRSQTQAIRFEDWSHDDVGQVERSKTSKSLDGVEFIPKPSGGNVQSKCPSDMSFHLRDDTQQSSHQRHQSDKYRSPKRKEKENVASRETHHPDTNCSDTKLSPHRTASSICGCDERYRDEFESVHECSSISQESDKCKFHCDDSLTGWDLRGVGSEPQETDYVDSSRKERCDCGGNSKAERKLFWNVVSRRKGCECESEKRNQHTVISSEPCDGLRPFGTIPRAAALAGKRCGHSLNRGSSCCLKDLQPICCDDFSHLQPLRECLDTYACPESHACNDPMPQAFKASDVSRGQRGRPIPSACSQQYRYDFETPTEKNGSTIIRSLLIDKNSQPNLQMIGEIAGQLESRIVQYVFAGLDRKSTYGILVRNIPEVIEISCFDREIRRVNVPLHFRLVKRFAYVKSSLRPFGYKFDFHPQFSIDMVNKYGRLDLPEAQTKFQLSPLDLDVRKALSSFIEANLSPSETEHVTILLDCLQLLASDDGKSLFIWQQK